MSTKSDTYRAALNALEPDAWDAYLRAESGLPGPRGNLELAAVAADLGSEVQFRRWLAWDAVQAPTGDPGEFLAFCGTVGMGRLLAEGWAAALAFIRAAANDPRWRQREGAAMALQRLGAVNMPALLDIAATWAGGTLLERRAAAAALAEPALLESRPEATRRALDVLDAITAGVERCSERRSEDFKALRKGMGYCWSVVVAALPEEGWLRLERWCGSPDPDVRWIVKENLGKTRLTRLDADRVARLLDKLKA
jgi:hypothetical protein